jgi:hypothetical protein
MSFNDTISSIEAEVDALKQEADPAVVANIEAELESLKIEEAPVVAEEALVVAEVATPAVNPNPIIQMAIDQAAARLARETAK